MNSLPEQIVSKLNIMPGIRVADFGAGDGRITLPLARAVTDSGKVYAIDIQKDLLGRLEKEARESGNINIEIIRGDLDRPRGSKLADDSVDLVLIANVLFLAEAPYHVALEAKRIVKPHGRVAVVEWKESFGGIGPPAGHVKPQEEVEEMFEKAGMKKDEEFTVGRYHYGVSFIY